MVLQGESAAVVQEHREALDRLAAQLGDALYGPDGMPWGTKFSDLESKAFEIGLAVARRIVQQRVAEQAQQPLPEELTRCPHCSGPLEMADQEPRHVVTRSGEVEWCEPQRTCRQCRKAFFPSVQEFGDRPERI